MTLSDVGQRLVRPGMRVMSLISMSSAVRISMTLRERMSRLRIISW
jgi:hypothetical protein